MDYAPFDGDGRKVAKIPAEAHTWPGAPMQVNNATARRSIEHFVREQGSFHSPVGGTVWIHMLWCRTHNRKYSVEIHYSGPHIVGYKIVLHS